MAEYRFNDAPAPLRDFLVYMESIRGRSQKTVDEYYLDLRTFFRYIVKNSGHALKDIPLEQIDITGVDLDLISSLTPSDVYEYLNYASRERLNNNTTRARKVSSIRSFYKYLSNKACVIDVSPICELDLPKLSKKLPRYLTIEESKRLLDSIDGTFADRDYAIVTLFLNCGLRLSELVGINLSDIQENSLRVTGKGDKERVLYLNDACKEAINTYLAVRPVDGVIDRNALFLSNRRTRLGHRMVQEMVKKYLVKAGLDPERYSVHKLRHTAATLMYQNGVDVRVLQEVLGHSNLGTTQIYTHLSDENVKQAALTNPLNKVHRKKE